MEKDGKPPKRLSRPDTPSAKTSGTVHGIRAIRQNGNSSTK